MLNACVKDISSFLPTIYHRHSFIKEHVFEKTSTIANIFYQLSKLLYVGDVPVRNHVPPRMESYGVSEISKLL